MLSFDSEQCLAFEPVLDEHNDAAIIDRLKAIDETWLKMIRFSRTSSPQFFRKLCVRVDAAAADLAAFLSCSTGQRRRDRSTRFVPRGLLYTSAISVRLCRASLEPKSGA